VKPRETPLVPSDHMPPTDHDDARDAERADEEPEELLTPSEVAAMFRVNPKTVTRWHRTGKVSAIRTLGGHRRFKASEIRRLLAQGEGA
jgi:excisionase family DNA binding protein